jgi:transposase
MLAFPATIRIFLAVEPVDMRKQFNGLWAEAQGRLEEDSFNGALFVFTNKRRNLVKLLYWYGSGVWVFANRHKTNCSH